MKEEEKIYIEKEGVSFFEVLKVLFGRKLILLVVTLGVALAGTVAAYVYNSLNKSYQANFSFSETQLNGVKKEIKQDEEEEKDKKKDEDEEKEKEYTEDAFYLNDTKFDIRNYFNEEALLGYKESVSSLGDIDVDKVVSENGVSEAKWIVVDEYNKDSQETKILKQDYQVIIRKRSFSEGQARALVKAATDKVIADNLKLLREIDRTEFLSLYSSGLMFEDKVSALNQEFEYIIKRYDELIKKFGNVKAVDGSSKLISDFKNEVAVEFQNTSFDGYLKEINNKALVYNKEQTLSLLEAQIDDIALELKYANDEKTDLTIQRDAVIAASDGKLTLDLESYNSRLVEITKKIYELEKEREIVNKKISIINTESLVEKTQNEAYVAEFTSKLEALAAKLDKYASDLGDIEVYQYQNSLKVYFDTTVVVKTVNSISVAKLALLSLLIGFVAALITNLCLDGKKLTKEYKKEEAK